MKSMPVWAGLLLTLCAAPTFAKTLLTEKNLDTYFQIINELDENIEDSEETVTPLAFDADCDWKNHYQRAIDGAPEEEVTQLTTIAQRHGFSPVEYFEFTYKMQWMNLDEIEMMLKSSTTMLDNMPADQRSELNIDIANQKEVIALLKRCMTDEDKKAAQRLKPVMLKKVMQMMGQ